MKLIDCGELQKALLRLENRNSFNLESVLECIAELGSHSKCTHDRFVTGMEEIKGHSPAAFWILYDGNKQIIFHKESFEKHYKEMQKNEIQSP